MVFSLLAIVIAYIGIAIGADGTTPVQLFAISLGELPGFLIYLTAFLYVLRRPLRRERMIQLVFWLIVITGSVGIIMAAMLTGLGVGQGNVTIEASSPSWEARASALNTVFVTHFVASLFMPWTLKESIRPLIPLLAVFFAVAIIVGGFTLGTALIILFSPLVGVPGVLICWWRHSRFRERFHYRMLRGKYGELQRELVDARNVHEGLFPDPIQDGPLRFQYCYEPMSQIGGDYLYATQTQPDADAPERTLLNVVLIDVTGHGVKAALTVNRIYGELERLYGEQPDLSPGPTLAALNRYFNLTLSKHSVFATALCMQFDVSSDSMLWANAGHPPAFLRTAAERMEQLEASGPLLGVFRRQEFRIDEHELRFGPGDTLIAYTDGVTDTLNEHRERLHIDGVRRILHTLHPDRDDRKRWCSTLLRAIHGYRFGAPVDDVLFVEVFRPIPDSPRPVSTASLSTAG